MSGFRRRLMMSIGKVEEVSPYPPDYVDDGRLWAYATISEDGTYQLTDDQHSYWSAMEIDGVAATLDRSQYLTAGEHIVKITMKDPSTLLGIFRGRSIYNKIIVPSCVTTLGDNCFRETAAQIVLHKELITSIGTQILLRATGSFGDIDFPNLTSFTGNSNFNDYYDASNSKIKNLGSIDTLPMQVFRGFVPKDNKYIIPATVTSIGQLAFYNRGSFTYYCYPVNPPTFGSSVFYDTPLAIYVPAESVEAYKAASGWSTYTNVIQAIPE